MNREASEVREISPGYGLETAKPVVPVGYKQTEVGVIPEDWDSVEVSQLLSEISMGPFGSDIKVSNFVSEGVPVLDGLNVRQERLLDEFSKFVTESKARSLKKAVARRGDVVITHRGTIGQVSYIPPDSAFDEYVISQSQFRARFNSDVLPQWVTVYFLSEWGSKKLLEGKGHTGVPAIAQPTTTFRKLRLPAPPIAEQRAIAQALSDVDALLEEMNRLIAKKRNIKQATMQHLLTGQTRLPGFEGEWETRQLGECLLAKPAYGINAPAAPFSDRLPAYVRITDITDDGRFCPEPPVSVKSTDTENYQLNVGDVVFARTGASVGKSYVYRKEDGDLVFAGFLIRVSPNPEILLHEFLAAYLTTDAYWKWVTLMSMRSGQPGINGNEYSKLEIPLPKVGEQKAIATVLSDMDAEISILKQRRAKTAALKKAMMQDLLTGRTRLVKPAFEGVR